MVVASPPPSTTSPLPLSSAHQTRLTARSGTLRTPTSTLSPGHIQANLLILPSAHAASFRTFCTLNNTPCPLLGWSLTPGAAHHLHPSTLITHPDFDIRTDLPLYNIYRSGKLIGTVPDLLETWTDDHVAFAIGCSFSFDAALAREGLVPRHVQLGGNVSMYRTTRKLREAGVFGGTWVVSMRPYRREDVERVREISRPFVGMHGEPVAWGWEAVEELGIRDLRAPEFGDAVEVKDGEVPVFWGCGVTPQIAVMEAGDKIQGVVMGHAPGHMLVLDVTDEIVIKNGGMVI